ncbi:MAG: exodeoxyribonuclease III [Rhodospirillaceae bacterium]
MFTIATWNINSIRKRIAQLERLIDLAAPDVICLQETKCEDKLFPRQEIADLGYVHQAYAGQRAYNGVAILSKHPLSEVDLHRHCGREDARHVSAVVGEGPGAMKVHSVYVPAGGPIADRDLNPKFDHKLKFVDAIADFFAGHHGLSDAAVVAGDFNIAPLPSDVWDHAKMSRIVTHTPIEIAALERMKRALYFIDALRELHPAENPVFTWWSYRAADWQATNKGRRLDHIWVTPALKDRIAKVDVLMDVRHWTPASDHVPVVLALKP